ncbi:MAG: DUF5611 family protein [Candidatus Thermoplasmatota archaeon]|nr:DUF5611 family protein [Candidatus Thermoplasmatota archaeon]
MRIYPVKKSKKLDMEILLDVFRQSFGNGELKEGYVTGSYPGLKSIRARVEKNGLIVETESARTENPMETVRKFNDFIESATGYSAKERKKLFSKD